MSRKNKAVGTAMLFGFICGVCYHGTPALGFGMAVAFILVAIFALQDCINNDQ